MTTRRGLNHTVRVRRLKNGNKITNRPISLISRTQSNRVTITRIRPRDRQRQTKLSNRRTQSRQRQRVISYLRARILRRISNNKPPHTQKTNRGSSTLRIDNKLFATIQLHNNKDHILPELSHLIRHPSRPRTHTTHLEQATHQSTSTTIRRRSTIPSIPARNRTQRHRK